MYIDKIQIFFILSLSVLLISCISTQPSQKDEYFLLPQPEISVVSKNPLPGSLVVLEPSMRGLTGEQNLIFRDKSNPAIIQRYKHHLWGYPPSQMIQDNLIYALKKAKIAKEIVRHEHRVFEDFSLNVIIFQLEHHRHTEPRASTYISVELGIVNNKCHTTILLKNYKSKVDVKKTGINGLLESYQENLTTIVDQFLKDFNQLSEAKLSEKCP